MEREQLSHAWNLIAKMLNNEATDLELHELEKMLKLNPDLHYPLQTIRDMWHPAGLGEFADEEQAFLRHLERMKALGIDLTTGSGAPRKRPKRKRHIIISTLALGALGIVLGFYFFRSPAPGMRKDPPQSALNDKEVVTHAGSRTNLTLPDGTLIWLNAGSRINYSADFGRTGREVVLNGEAFFDVATDPQKPFIIHTGKVDIKVLGTRFNIRSYPTDRTTEATLIKGSIEVDIKNGNGEKYTLRPNEKLILNNDQEALSAKPRDPKPNRPPAVQITKPTVEAATGAVFETAWVDNRLMFRDEDFGTLASRLERWYGITIRFGDPQRKDLRFTGTFRHETIGQALDALQLTADFKYNIQGNTVIIQ